MDRVGNDWHTVIDHSTVIWKKKLLAIFFILLGGISLKLFVRKDIQVYFYKCQDKVHLNAAMFQLQLGHR